MNDFSLVCRVLGSLFYRQPQDPLLEPLFTLISQGKLEQHWPLEQSELLVRLQQEYLPEALAADYNALFVGDERSVSPYGSDYEDARPEAEVRAFLQQCGMPLLGEAPTDHFGGLLLAASWLEDQAAEDEVAAQIELFDAYLLPWCGRFLGKVEAHATSGFYRTLAQLSREALQAMWDELSENNDTEE
ncbi:putative oxidoreductase component of anaerobic dehydrogenases%3B Functional role page for Chaperone protein TorD [Yersinia enterocolitica]|uniref:TorD/DmsD family molecular chaperone n=1 Tax=Yersinia enterocolitica TaxID=630 RepID=UPI0005E59913|nr:molecular chaperone [Yersinia enterocolitica]ELI8282374.1 molecular chaperone [Yersinia enterocolitica]MCE3127262.1 molecular chaperone [Yersinia enterocolitica]CFQ11566.1 putative oxidoreductase component of anaerobic dehydrogenases%3B Functional role page for Chaperone protein TorD [Yersinia enterocolitica]CNE60911.1 putative oxidoreductase component of anaerobic dehydrogenases%3B Functional role page for Chaperone protein TorD [Yersinia enterocolitica]CNF93797.1 putative oxidoreductase c